MNELKTIIKDLGYVKKFPKNYVLHFKAWNKTFDDFFVVGCEQKLLSAKNFNKKRPLDLYLHESKKKLVVEKDSNSGDDFRVEVNSSLEK